MCPLPYTIFNIEFSDWSYSKLSILAFLPLYSYIMPLCRSRGHSVTWDSPTLSTFPTSFWRRGGPPSGWPHQGGYPTALCLLLDRPNPLSSRQKYNHPRYRQRRRLKAQAKAKAAPMLAPLQTPARPPRAVAMTARMRITR